MWQIRTYLQKQHCRSREPEQKNLVLISFDKKSLQKMFYPKPRKAYSVRGFTMKGSVKRQRCELAETSADAPNLKTKYLNVVVFEREGKTVIQPVFSSQDAPIVQELFQNNTLEVWLSNGKSDTAEFDVSILKYKPQLQTPTQCNRTRNRVCLKNCFDTIACCEQCPLGEEEASWKTILERNLGYVCT